MSPDRIIMQTQFFKPPSTRPIRARLRLGDKVEAVTKAVGIKPCAGCKKRKDWLNGVDNDLQK